MESFIYIFVAMLVIFIIARIMKDSRVFTRLCLVALVSFVLGAFVKNSFLSKDESKVSVSTENVTYPMVYSPAAECITADTFGISSKDCEVSDAFTVAPDHKIPKTKQNNPEIINDS